MPSRRTFLAGIAGGVSLTAGCLNNENTIARCSSKGEGSKSQYLRRIAPITGDEQVALGVMVSNEVPQQERFEAIDVRNRDGDLVVSIPLENNREMSGLDPEDHAVFTSERGELYAVPLGPPPVHGDLEVSIVNPSGQQITTASIRFSCYSNDGTLP